MDGVVENMYVLVMPFYRRRSRLFLQTSTSSKLGQVSLSGYIHHGRGLPLHPPRVYGMYALVYLLEGSGWMKSGNLPLMKCRAGDLLFVFPEIPQAYGPGPRELWSEFYVTFSGPVFDLWRRAGLLQPQRPIQRLADFRHWLPQLEAVVDSHLPDTPKGMLQRVCRLQKFLGDIVEEPEPAPHPVPWLESAMRQLSDTPETPPAAIARSLGVSYETFRKEFTRLTGQPPARYRLHRLVDQARVLMTERNLSNKQLAETLGFYDEFHFSRRFRQVTGQSTREFRHGGN
jgi:AraC-like DNA-binding protein